MTTDLKAISYMLFNNYDYQKPSDSKAENRQFFGNGAFLRVIVTYTTIEIRMVKRNCIC